MIPIFNKRKKMSGNCKQFKVSINGVTPLIMHNSESADPRNKWTLMMKPLKDKRSKKTESDMNEINDISFLSSLYWSDDLGGLYMPTDNIRKMLLEAGRGCDQKGAKKQIVGVRFSEYLGYKLITPNRDNIKALKVDDSLRYFKIVTIGKAKVPSIRAIFKEWSFDIEITIDCSIVNPSTVEEWFEYAGDRVGLGGRRPYAPTPGEFGRFQITEFKEI